MVSAGSSLCGPLMESYLYHFLVITLTGLLKVISNCGTDLYLIPPKYIWTESVCLSPHSETQTELLKEKMVAII